MFTVPVALLLKTLWKATGPGPLYTITTIAGEDPAIAGPGFSPESLALDRAGNLYIGERSTGRVRKMTPAGTMTTIAGPGVAGFSADGANGTVQLGASLGVAAPPPPTLTITNVASSASATGATVTWSTGVPATSQVFYGTTSVYGR